ncbi:HyaD/HybD family hydrogenase maturation endopeptidase [Helicobacter winghamensis]|uniref:Hydrogenase expression/formation protein n=1 Tax=Helicobacter winghamensis TaxID=157268 RepID=A0A2N3PIG6_9HELI|nr:HyaD/HybD family hydrogenase maturation endopeptidase [Helicobacter winghamensis]EEO25724.1 hydrogenase expression/formation protein [Helicobacter winghamensis ATCC BAA-430]PKT76030.1 hydrogenase expression/formation protein [Helicobacter winghamensis]PKT76660.1 hydrogenase expression/formation protein [Helicobacter winghamensis]PKT76779.1 hydrogenase expression/formation protein [Helicobacter winghamensis]PKT80540.1 hydrogenase expression/formation protein [Helicobacter winghamensis]
MKILILGIGNILFGDEGIGVHLSNLLKLNYKFSGEHSVDIIDGGTMAQHLIPLISEYDSVLIIDSIDANDAKVGDVYFFDFNAIPNAITWAGSAHEVEMLQTLQMIEMLGDLPPTKILGIKPFIIGENTTFDLTQEVLQGAKLMEAQVIKHLEALGVKAQKIDNRDLQEIARFSYRGYE